MRTQILLTAPLASALLLAACSETPAEAPADTATVDAPVSATEEAITGVLDASTVTAEQLAAVDGVDEELAAAIVAGQPYSSAADFNAVLLKAGDEAKAAAIRERVFVPVNLNTATEAELKLIPGMTEQMEHEFLEYRPYSDMSEFDREIGKYVSEEEVARFRNYVTL